MPPEQPIARIAPDLPNADEPLPGVATAGMPRAEHFARLAAAGYTTVLDLCAPEEPRGYDEPAVAAMAGLEYVNVPVRSYAPDDAAFDEVRAVLKEAARRPVLFHCGSASRVGGLLLPYLILDESKTPEEALEVAARVGLRSPALAQAALDYAERRRRAPG